VPAVLVENELAFPGWTAVREDDGTVIEPVAAAWPLRAWKVPAGDYSLALTFRMPARRAAASVTLAATAVWLALLVVQRFRARAAPPPVQPAPIAAPS
jgi:hypothetical protein